MAALLAAPPDQVVLGEVKPASNELVAAGKKQLDNYDRGIEFARKQTNCWAQANGVSGQWQKNSVTRLNPAITSSMLPIQRRISN
jgi:hypothetical protein